MIDEALHRDALSRFVSGVTIITTARKDGGIAGLTASAFTSLSLHPPLILVCVGGQSSSREAVNASQSFAVHILAEEQQSLAMAFAKSSENKADGILWTLSKWGTPILDDYLVAIECRQTKEFFGGDHAIIIGEIIDIKIDGSGREPMTYYRGQLNTLMLKK